MSTITITLPDDVKARLEKQSLEKGFVSVNEYIQEMIRVFQEFQPDEELTAYLERPDVASKLEAKLLEGLNSPTVVADEAFWQERRKKLRDKHPEIDFDAK